MTSRPTLTGGRSDVRPAGQLAGSVLRRASGGTNASSSDRPVHAHPVVRPRVPEGCSAKKFGNAELCRRHGGRGALEGTVGAVARQRSTVCPRTGRDSFQMSVWARENKNVYWSSLSRPSVSTCASAPHQVHLQLPEALVPLDQCSLPIDDSGPGVAALDDLGDGAQTGQAHDLQPGVGLGEPLADDRLGRAPRLGGGGDDRSELLGEPQLLGQERRPARSRVWP